ncbi:MAG: orotidine-5'-phosphate decarboxylase [Flavobacteriales bacterium]|nr:orotidine-5'-phosphate decarboxylase [Flavobacteriales bacterium]
MKLDRDTLFQRIKEKKSFLCIGLDSDYDKIPAHLHKYEDPIYEFNKSIIDATKDFCVAYKPNLAFYESTGAAGWKSLEKTMAYIPKDIFTIADAKRGDIGNTSNKYAKAFFKRLSFDSVTVNPYMGEDAISPYLKYDNKWVVILALTSNNSAKDFQTIAVEGGKQLYERVLEISQKWGHLDNTMYVVGATKASELENIRKIVPDHFLLVPGVGSQGGDLQEVSKYGLNDKCGLLVNMSRGVIFAGQGMEFAIKAKEKAQEVQKEMEAILTERGLI